MRRELLTILWMCLWMCLWTGMMPAAPVAGGDGGDFSLTDQDGRRFQLSDHRGKVILLFFGYTSCTEACPVMLARINSLYRQLGPDRERVLSLFVSLDPERDTPPLLREYVKYFSARTVALTGSKEEIDAVAQQYGARYEVEKTGSALGYQISHTTDIYLIDQRGALRSRFKHSAPTTVIAGQLKRLIG